MTASKARICCLDLDTFFVSVERLIDPSLEGKPVIVGGRPGARGVVTAASYEVRELGVRSGMSLTEAARLAPQAIFLPTRHDTYGGYSKRVRELIEKLCPVVQVASIDEFFLDLRGCERLYRQHDDWSDDETTHRVVCSITSTIKKEIGLPASAGIATSKPVSKIASGLAKPKGVLLIPAGQEAEFLAPLPVRKFPGIGPVGERGLAKLGMTTLGEVSRAPIEQLRRIFGAWADSIKRGAMGQGASDLGRDRPAFREHDPAGCAVGSISNERTFREDVGNPRLIEAMLCSLCERVCWRARKRGAKGRTVTLKLRYADFHTITRSRTMTPTNSEIEIYPVVTKMFHNARTRKMPVRLLGIALSNLGLFEAQIPLFDCRDRRLYEAMDSIRTRYGFDALRMAAGHKKTAKNKMPPSIIPS